MLSRKPYSSNITTNFQFKVSRIKFVEYLRNDTDMSSNEWRYLDGFVLPQTKIRVGSKKTNPILLLNLHRIHRNPIFFQQRSHFRGHKLSNTIQV